MSTIEKTDPDFPLTKHPRGYFCKRILGKLHYFGKRNATKYEALRDYEFKRPYLEEGVEPPQAGGVRVEEALDRFLAAKNKRMQAGELTKRSYEDYRSQCHRIMAVISKQRNIASLLSSDFDRLFASFKGTPKSIEGYVTRSKVAFKWIEHDQGIKFNYGENFRKPSARRLRLHRSSQPKRLFEPVVLREFVKIAGKQIKAMILLGINCGFGNEDCATLTIEKLDLTAGWHNHGRPKTGVDRRAKLWSDTIEALRVVVGDRKKGLVFITKYGNPWTDGNKTSPIGQEFKKLARRLESDRTFYDLRRTFQTVADNSKDPVAVKAIMGHVDASMSGVYRQLVPDDRLEAVASVVGQWFKGT